MKKTYIIPVLNITTIQVERVIALSGPKATNTPANQEYGMDAKEQSTSSYNVWDDDWNK